MIILMWNDSRVIHCFVNTDVDFVSVSVLKDSDQAQIEIPENEEEGFYFCIWLPSVLWRIKVKSKKS